LAKKFVLTSTKANYDKIIISIAYYGILKIVYLEMSFDETQDLDFRSWHYVTIKASIVVVQDDNIVLDNEKDNNDIISNFECTMSIIDCEFLHKQSIIAIIKHIA